MRGLLTLALGAALAAAASGAVASCNGGFHGNEVSVGAGGGGGSRACAIAEDCPSFVCAAGRCLAPSCKDGVKNGAETDVDCGGPMCPACAVGKRCAMAGDCQSQDCASQACQAASCTDGVKNGDETDVDCGGPTCGKCADGKGCLAGSDCADGVCKSGQCQAPSCSDGVKNGQETDVDCGGPTCPGCADGKACAMASDCQSQVCAMNACQPPNCEDGVKNGAETDVDCGGPKCPGCHHGKECLVAKDCISSACVSQKCYATTCKQLLAEDPAAASGAYSIAPDAATAFQVYCDLVTDGGGWTLVAINGDVSDLVDPCFPYTVSVNAVACGGATPSLTSDWQLAGNLQNLIPFSEILMNGYQTPLVYETASKLVLGQTTNVGNGVFMGAPVGIGNNPLIGCGDLSVRTRIGIDSLGQSLWGQPFNCGPEQLTSDIGLDTQTSPGGGNEFPGWDDNNDGCGCGNIFVPANAGSLRGYYGLR